MFRIILASRSPRRKKLLEQLGLNFEVAPSSVDETLLPGIGPAQAVIALSDKKASAVARHTTGTLVIGADTIVVLDGEILGQPSDSTQAAEMLRSLSGKTHEVFSGVTVIRTDFEGDESRLRFYEQTKVTIAPLTDQEIDLYIRSGSPLDKAGAYGIQDDWGSAFVSGIEGDYYTVVGFPIHAFYRRMKEFAPEIMFKAQYSHDEK